MSAGSRTPRPPIAVTMPSIASSSETHGPQITGKS
jgi:hypothetical protein